MSLFSRLFKKEDLPDEITCPRCLGKGNVDAADIIRLKRVGKWTPGACAYCLGTGSVDRDMPANIPTDAAYLTTDLSSAEREAVMNFNTWGSSFPLTEKREGCPVLEQNRLWLEEGLLLLSGFFGPESIRGRQVLIPHHRHFPIRYDGSERTAYETAEIVARQMEIPFDNIGLEFYSGRVQEMRTGGNFGDRIFLEMEEDQSDSAGLYEGMGTDGKYRIHLSNERLSQPESLVAVLAHEMAHIKLLGEDRMTKNNEYLTDLTTVFFGLGIFNANVAFQTYKGFDVYGWQKLGYLNQMQWAYALALFARMRGEQSPAWAEHLTPNVKSDFRKGQAFIADNPQLVFQSPLH